MAARIGSARLQADPNLTIKAADYDFGKRPPVVCPYHGCLCRLEAVSGSTRNIGTEQIQTLPFFRLPKRADDLGIGHKPLCKFNLTKTVSRLVAMSREVKGLDSKADVLLSGSGQRLAEFRIHILMELLRHSPRSQHGTAAERYDSVSQTVGNKYVRSNQLLKPYFRMAKAVLSLVARIGNRDELAQIIRLRYGSHTLKWSEYFFDFDHYPALYEYLVEHRQFQRGGPDARPVAVAVKISDRPVRETQFGNWQVNCRACPGESSGLGPVALTPVIYTRDKELAERMAQESHLLVCAIPTTDSSLRNPEKKWLKPSAALRLIVLNRSQICRYNPTLGGS